MNIVLMILILLANGSMLRADGLSVDEAGSAFREGNASFQRGDFDGAVRAYEEILSEGYLSGPLYYNLGNAYYRSGDFARAILNYERALSRMPNDEDLHHNLEMARLMIVDQIVPVPRLFLWDYLDSLRDSLSISTLTALAYAAFVIILVGIALAVLTRRMRTRRLGALAGSIAVVILILTLFLLNDRVTHLTRSDHGIVLSEVIDVKNAPDREGPSAFILHAGTKVKITDRVGEWIQIRLIDGKVGWMEETGLEII